MLLVPVAPLERLFTDRPARKRRGRGVRSTATTPQTRSAIAGSGCATAAARPIRHRQTILWREITRRRRTARRLNGRMSDLILRTSVRRSNGLDDYDVLSDGERTASQS